MTRKINEWYLSADCKEAMRLYENGLSLNETAKRFGVNRYTIQYAVKKYGVKSCISFMEGQRIANEKRSRGELPMPDNHERLSKATETRMAIRLLQNGFNYLGGYEPKSKRPFIKICCQACGTVFVRSFETVNYGKLDCPSCKHKQATERQAEKERAHKAEVEVRRKEQKAKQAVKLKEREQRLNTIRSCKVCGCDYTIKQYMERTGMTYERNSGFCSPECRDKHKKALRKLHHSKGQDNNRKRARIYGCKYERGITLKKAVERLGLTCALCGKPCNWNDRSYGKYCGAYYPSIDHIIPMSKGGGHTWDNIQVAHIICNSKKETTILGGDAV